MRIAYVTAYDATDIRNWSGLGTYIAKALEQQGSDITFIGPLKEYDDAFLKAKRILHRYVTRKNYQTNREPKVLRCYAEQIEKSLKNMNVDIVFSPGTLPLCYLECNEPQVFWTDATYAGMVNFYPNWLNICRSSLKFGNSMEQAALSRCRLAIYSSDWAAETAFNNYDVDSSKIKVVPFGANIECNRTIEDIKAAINKRSQNICRLLFLGVHWYRKGGDIALRVAKELNKQGLRTELCIVGCKPPIDVPDFVSVKGFISKTTQQGRNTLEGILAEVAFPPHAVAGRMLSCRHCRGQLFWGSSSGE